jgi:luciferase-like monooxygenase
MFVILLARFSLWIPPSYIEVVLKVAVHLPATIDDVGEYLADVTALEAAGADAIWLDDTGLDPWVVLGAMAAVTRRIGLGCLLSSAGPIPAARLGAPVAALQLLSRGRIAIGLPPRGKVASHVAALRRAKARIFATGSPRRSAEGVILEVESADQIGAAPATHIEVWAAIAIPSDREAWTSVLSAYEAAGATGVIVPWSARLVDLLRNSEPDDRSDLLMSTG